MKDTLAPSLVEHMKDHSILWFQKSNQYILVAKSLFTLIEAFLVSKSGIQFVKTCTELGHDAQSANQFITEIGQFLEDCNKTHKPETKPIIRFSDSHRVLSHFYQLDDQTIAVHCGSEELRSLVHPQLEHLETTHDGIPILCEFDIYIHNNHLVLFKDEVLLGSWQSKDYHLLQGKFAMHILCALHHNEENDWIGTFHASAVANNEQAIMIVGDSGNGKSTFTALLLAHGFDILADDLTPILASDSLVYPYPGGISIKSGSFDVLKSSFPDFDRLPEHYINPYKGFVKYIGAPKSKGYLKGYPCTKMLRIHYKAGSETKLETISMVEALNTLIPESWLAHKPENAQLFFNWIKAVEFYELTYSDSNQAIKEFSSLLNV